MSHPRRSFLRAGTLLLGAVVLMPAASFAARHSPIPIDDAESAVLDWARTYCPTARIVARSRGPVSRAHLVANVEDFGALWEASTATAGFGPVYAHKNTLSFTYGGTTFTVENRVAPRRLRG